MTDKEKDGWIKFVPSLDLPKERVSIAYDTHDDRGYRFAYGYFQFYNGTCGCFWKDGNEQPKVVKVEDIRYWMTVPSLDVQEEPLSEDKMTISKEWFEHCKKSWYNEGYIDGKYNRNRQFEEPVSDDLEEEIKRYLHELYDRDTTVGDIARHFAKWQKKQMMAKAVVREVKVDAGGYPYIGETELYDYDKDIPLAKKGDKVKVIVIKED